MRVYVVSHGADHEGIYEILGVREDEAAAIELAKAHMAKHARKPWTQYTNTEHPGLSWDNGYNFVLMEGYDTCPTT